MVRSKCVDSVRVSFSPDEIAELGVRSEIHHVPISAKIRKLRVVVDLA